MDVDIASEYSRERRHRWRRHRWRRNGAGILGDDHFVNGRRIRRSTVDDVERTQRRRILLAHSWCNHYSTCLKRNSIKFGLSIVGFDWNWTPLWSIYSKFYQVGLNFAGIRSVCNQFDRNSTTFDWISSNSDQVQAENRISLRLDFWILTLVYFFSCRPFVAMVDPWSHIPPWYGSMKHRVTRSR